MKPVKKGEKTGPGGRVLGHDCPLVNPARILRVRQKNTAGSVNYRPRAMYSVYVECAEPKGTICISENFRKNTIGRAVRENVQRIILKRVK